MLPALSYRGIDASSSPTGDLHDEFVPGSEASIGLSASEGFWGVAQSWDSGADPQEVVGVGVSLSRNGTAQGSFRLAVFAHSGSFGSSSVPASAFEGDALVVSDEFAVDSLAVDALASTDYFFPLSGWTPAANTDYTVALLSDADFGTSNDELKVWADSGPDADHGGNLSELGSAGSWSAQSTQDMAFKVYYAAAPAVGGGDGPATTRARGIRGWRVP